MDDDKAIRSAKLTLGGMLEKKRAKSAVERAKGQIAPSKYLPNVPRQVHADGGSAGMGDNGGPPLSEPPVDLGQVREQKHLQTFHKSVMGDIGTRMTQAMEAHQKAVDAGHFDGYEVGDVLQGRGSPLKITGRYVQQWKPNRMTLEHFDRMGAKPTIIEHEGQQYIPMLRYTSGSEAGGDNQEGSLYLDAVKATGMRKMGGLRAVKANGGAIHLIHGGADFDEIDPRFSGTGEPGNIRPLGKGLYTFVLDPNDPDSAKEAIGWAKRYATKYGRGKKTLHVFQVPASASTVFNGPRSIEGMGAEPQDKLAAYRAHRDAEPAKDDPAWWDWSRKSNALYEDVKNAADLRMERLPIGLTEAAINNPKVAQRVGKFDPEADPDEIIKAIRGYASGGYVPAAVLPVPKLAVAKPLLYDIARPSGLEALAGMAGSASQIGETAGGFFGKEAPPEQPPAQDGHAGRAEAGGGMSPQAVAAYNALLEAYGRPLTVTSTYRDPAENQRVKGAKNSQHMHGNAYDIDTSGMSYEDRLALADMAWNAGFRGVGFYDNSMHFDVGDPRSWGPTYSRDSIPDWAQDWTQQRYGYADGGSVSAKERFLAGNHPDVPEVLYHGTAPRIVENQKYHGDGNWTSEVDQEATDRNIAAHDFREFMPSKYGNYGPGIYLTDRPETASQYAMGIRADQSEPKPHGSVMKLHVSMKKPFTDDVLKTPRWKAYLRDVIGNASVYSSERPYRDALLQKLDDGTATVRDLFLHDTPNGTMVNQWGNDEIHSKIRIGFDGIIANRPDGSKEYVAFKPGQVKSAISATKFDPNNPDMTFAEGGAAPTMSPLLIEEEMKRDAMRKPDAAAQTGQALDAISNAGKVGSIAGKLTGIPLGGVMGRKLAESIAMSEYGYADGGAAGGYVPQRTQKAYKLFRTKGDGNLYPLFVHADKPVEMGKWLEAEEGPQGKAQGKVKSKLGDLAYRPGWHAGDLPIATHIGGKSSPDLKKPDYRPDNHVWAEVEMAADKDWQAEADSRGKGVKAHITDQVPLKGFYRYKTNPNMTGNWLIGGHMKVNRVLSDDEVKSINDQAGVADLPRLDRVQKADGGSIVERSPMFEGMHEELYDEDGKPTELWHGTPHQFDAFDDSKVGSERDHGWYGRGHYLTPDLSAAADYASDDPDEGHVMGPLHAALKNPYVWDVSDDNRAHRTLRDLQSMGIMRGTNKLEPWSNLASHEIDTFMKHMQDRGHDGVLMKTQKERGRAGISEVVVFKPNMIKHRDAEVGDPEDPRIMRNLGGRLYSKASKIISRLKDEPMQVEDIIKYALENGAKRSEIDYSDPPRGGMARPSQVAKHIADMQPQVGVQRREGGNFRFKNSDEYLRELDRLNNRGMHDEAERLYDEFERFEGYGGANQPRYARYQLPGGDNYREHILTLDNHQGQTYTAPIHWSGTQNPLAHIRMSDRIIGNRKILHIEELQSDWNNDARKRGFSTGTEQQDYDNFVSQMRQKAIDKVNARTGQEYYDPVTGETAPTMSPMVAQAQIEKYQRMDPYMLAMKMGMQEEHRQLAQAAKGGNGVPRAPYINPDRDDVTELAMKHILTEAAKGGYDGIAFTPDAAQSERWKGTNFKNMYDRKFPGMAQRLIRQHDPQGGSDDDPQIINGWGAPHVELTDKARQSILQNGFSSFRRGGYVTHVRRAR